MPPAPSSVLVLVPGILTVWRSSPWISDKSAHKFSQRLTSQQDKSSLYSQVIESAEDDEMTVNQCGMTGGEAEAMTAFVICSGLSSHRATVVTVIDRPPIPIHSPAAARCFYWYRSPWLLQHAKFPPECNLTGLCKVKFAPSFTAAILNRGRTEPSVPALVWGERCLHHLVFINTTLWKQPVFSVAMTMWAWAMGGSEESFNRMAVFESGASSRQPGIDYRCLNVAAALRMLFIVIESASGGTPSFREDECTVVEITRWEFSGLKFTTQSSVAYTSCQRCHSSFIACLFTSVMFENVQEAARSLQRAGFNGKWASHRNWTIVVLLGCSLKSFLKSD